MFVSLVQHERQPAMRAFRQLPKASNDWQYTGVDTRVVLNVLRLKLFMAHVTGYMYMSPLAAILTEVLNCYIIAISSQIASLDISFQYCASKYRVFL